jgi:hypothetical protein
VLVGLAEQFVAQRSELLRTLLSGSASDELAAAGRFKLAQL